MLLLILTICSLMKRRLFGRRSSSGGTALSTHSLTSQLPVGTIGTIQGYVIQSHLAISTIGSLSLWVILHLHYSTFVLITSGVLSHSLEIQWEWETIGDESLPFLLFISIQATTTTAHAYVNAISILSPSPYVSNSTPLAYRPSASTINLTACGV